jgi:hypothetical protein
MRAGRAESHPVFDFLFTYYNFRPAQLLRWSPGADAVLADCPDPPLDWPLDTVRSATGWVIPAQNFPRQRVRYLTWAHHYLQRVAEREPNFSCFGLHEWAMVYGTSQVRHTSVPLRLSAEQIATAVDSLGLRCSHYDAFRFFTPAATPRNREQLSREATADHDQRGCIHVTMDLYKFAFKIAPWCPSSLIADAFALAAEARQIDMRASPYDLQDLGFEPIAIETTEGRQEYLRAQRAISERATPIRTRLLQVYAHLLSATGGAESL